MTATRDCPICIESARRHSTPTPTLPAALRRSPCSREYTSIYDEDLCPEETRLFGTESLYGNWNGELLLLAKDFAPASVIRSRLQRDARPFRAGCPCKDPGVPMGHKTNKRLVARSQDVPFGIVYGSALAGLLRNDGKASGPLPAPAKIAGYVTDVVNFTISSMPNLRAIACLGREAWEFTLAALLCPPTDRRWHRTERQPLLTRGVKVFAMGHPGNRESNAAIDDDWTEMARQLSAQR